MPLNCVFTSPPMARCLETVSAAMKPPGFSVMPMNGIAAGCSSACAVLWSASTASAIEDELVFRSATELCRFATHG